MDCIALMVAIDNDGNEIYVSVELDIGNEDPPKNNPEDIRRCVELFNQNKVNNWRYIDMFGIIKNGIVEQWEEIDNV